MAGTTKEEHLRWMFLFKIIAVSVAIFCLVNYTHTNFKKSVSIINLFKAKIVNTTMCQLCLEELDLLT